MLNLKQVTGLLGEKNHWNIIALYKAMEMALQNFLVEQDR